jgi:hypothetical protein
VSNPTARERASHDATHVYPTNDLAQHVLEGDGCPCGPKVKLGGHLVVHNSWDRRELYEQAEALIGDANG